MTRKVHIDPFTEEEIFEKADEALDCLIEELEVDDMDIDDLEMQEVAKMFFYNGFVTGARLTAIDEKFREAITLMNDEIDYQTKEK